MQRLAIQHGNTVTVYNGRSATVANYNKALATADSHVVVAGHSVEDKSHTAGAVHLADGDVGTMQAQVSKNANVPVSNVQASTVGVFGCNTFDLANQYSNTTFTGVASGKNGGTTLTAVDSSARAYTNVIAKDSSVDAATAAANSTLKASPDRRDHDGDQVKTVKDPNDQN